MDRIGQGKRWQPFGEINSESVLFFHHAQGEAVWVAFFLLGTLSWGYDFDSLCKLWSIQMSLWSERMFRISSPKIGRHRNSSIQKFHCFSPFPVCQKHTSKLWVREDNWAINAPFLERQRLYINGHHFQHNPLKIPVWRVADSCFWEKKTQTCPLVKQGRNCSLHAAGSPNLNHFWLNFLFIESKLRLPTKIAWTRFAFSVRTIHPQLEINPSRMCSMYAGFSFKNC